MHTVLVDTNAYVAFKRNDPTILKVFQHVPHIIVPSIVLGELLAGFLLGRREPQNREDLARFLDAPLVEILSATEKTADYYALIYGGLRKKGRPIPSNDLWIAAAAMERGATLLTLDSHFKNIDGLRTGSCLEDFFP